MASKIVLLTFFIFYSIIRGTQLPQQILLAHEDKEAYPWISINRQTGELSGIDIEFIKLLEKNSGISIKMVPLPWARTLEYMKSGKIDGTFSASYMKERELFGKYPPYKNGVPDEKYAVHFSSYSLYILKGSKVSFKNGNFINLNGIVGTQLGFSITQLISKMNVKVDASTSDPYPILKKLVAGRIEACAIQTERADKILRDNPEFKDIVKLTILEPPFNKKPYFIMLSNDFVKQNPEAASYIWQEIKKINESNEFKNILKNFYNN